MRVIVCLCLLVVLPGLLLAQKQFQVTFSTPDSMAIKQLSFYGYDCEKRDFVHIDAAYDKHTATFSHSYNTVYPYFFAAYGSGDSRSVMRLYTTGKPATVRINGPVDEKDPFKHCTLTNATRIDGEFSAAEAYTKAAQQNYDQLYDVIAPKWKVADSLDFYKLHDAKQAIDSARLVYICKHPDDYSSFLLFNLFTLDLLPPALLLKRFNTVFPASFRNSKEGASIKEKLMNRAAIDGEKKAISFTARDIDSNKVVFKDIYSKQYTLLVFWGTWCPPCIAEIPTLRELRRLYSKQQLEIVSVAVGSELAKVRQIIKEQEMDWVHIVNDQSIPLRYEIHAYPDTFLINNNGDIVYRYSAYPDPGFEHLKQILATRVGGH